MCRPSNPPRTSHPHVLPHHRRQRRRLQRIQRLRETLRLDHRHLRRQHVNHQLEMGKAVPNLPTHASPLPPARPPTPPPQSTATPAIRSPAIPSSRPADSCYGLVRSSTRPCPSVSQKCTPKRTGRSSSVPCAAATPGSPSAGRHTRRSKDKPHTPEPPACKPPPQIKHCLSKVARSRPRRRIGAQPGNLPPEWPAWPPAWASRSRTPETPPAPRYHPPARPKTRTRSPQSPPGYNPQSPAMLAIPPDRPDNRPSPPPLERTPANSARLHRSQGQPRPTAPHLTAQPGRRRCSEPGSPPCL